MSGTQARAIDLLARELYEGDPQPTYDWLRDHAPLYRDETNGLWAVSRHADIVSISRDPERFSSARGSRPNTDGSGSMIDNDDPKHLAFRRIFQKEITPRGARGFEARLREIVDDLFEGKVYRQGSEKEAPRKGFHEQRILIRHPICALWAGRAMRFVSFYV